MSHDMTKVAGKALCGVAVASLCTISWTTINLINSKGFFLAKIIRQTFITSGTFCLAAWTYQARDGMWYCSGLATYDVA